MTRHHVGNVTPRIMEPGDECLVVVKVMMNYRGNLVLYRCPWAPMDTDPQGEHMYASDTYLPMTDPDEERELEPITDLDVLVERLFPALSTLEVSRD